VPGRPGIARRVARLFAAVGAVTAVLVGMTAFTLPASAAPPKPTTTYKVIAILNGKNLHHLYTKAGSSKQYREALADPDDITRIGNDLFTTFQNGVGPQGQASTDGNRDSTIVEYTLKGTFVHQWDLVGKCDGLTADPYTGKVVATINEDAHSSLYTIDPATNKVLDLSQSVDDTAWSTSWHGAFYADSTSDDTVDEIQGSFWPGTAFVAVTPCDANNAPATCPAPGFPANYLGHLNMYNGQIVPVSVRGAALNPQGMIFVRF
jgi:hypothetical protein